MNYTHDENQVIFLKDTDIVKDISGNNFANSAVISNGVASYNLVSAVSSTASGDVQYLSGKLSTLSGRFDLEQTDNISAIRYRGEVTLSGTYSYPNWYVTLDKKLIGLFLKNEYISNPNTSLKAGYLFKAVADNPASAEYDIDGVILHPNDYLFLKRDVASINDITFNDINIIRDYDLSVKNLSSKVYTLETNVGDETTGLIANVNSISTNVICGATSLSTKFGTLDTNFTTLSGDLLRDDNCIIPILCTAITTTLSDAITGISNEISAENVGLSAKVISLSTTLLTDTTGLIPVLCNDITSTISDAISSISDAISAPDVGLSAQVTSISNVVLVGDNSLSGKLSTLSGNLLSGKSSIISVLSDAISTIRGDIKGGVVYQGHLVLDEQTHVSALSDYVAIFYDNGSTTHTDATLAKPLSNGWMYYISFNPGTPHEGITDVGSFKTNEANDKHIEFVPGNYIIVHSHNSADSVALSNLGRDLIDIVQVTDSDLVRFKNLNEAIGEISDAISNDVTGLCATINSISNTLSDSLSTYSESLCTLLSTNLRDVIDNKIILSAIHAGSDATSSKIDTLIINRMTAAEYAINVANNAIADDLLYSITDDKLNAYGKQIVSVAIPNDDEDAANKKYVDDEIDALSVDKLSTRFDAAFETGVAGDEKLTLFNGNNPSDKYLLQMLSGTLVLKLKS